MRFTSLAVLCILAVVAFQACATKQGVAVRPESVTQTQTALMGDYDIIGVDLHGFFLLQRVGGWFHLEQKRFAYAFFLDNQKVLEFKGDLHITPTSFSMAYDDFLFVERLDYLSYNVEGARYLELALGLFISQEIEARHQGPDQSLDHPKHYLVLRKKG